jgi:hypothetical protein
LFLDELSLYRKDVLEALRAPLEDGAVRIARSGGVVVYPCRFAFRRRDEPVSLWLPKWKRVFNAPGRSSELMALSRVLGGCGREGTEGDCSLPPSCASTPAGPLGPRLLTSGGTAKSQASVASARTVASVAMRFDVLLRDGQRRATETRVVEAEGG